MCGIAGFIQNSDFTDSLSHNIVNSMSETLTHRGPNSRGSWVSDNSKVALGFRRLAILDLSPAGSQPMISRSGRFIMVFNGEIYNHKELRKSLNNISSRSWKGRSDSETLLDCFEEFGVKESFKKLVGMFAIGVWDKKKNTLILARDRLGEKPLYYGFVNNNMVFGSELKAIKIFPNFSNSISRASIAEYLKYKYIPAPQSIYQNIFKLKPGCYIEFSIDNFIKSVNDQIAYWSLSESIHDSKSSIITDPSMALDNLEKLLSESINLQMQSDVPLGSFLSGGIDSSLITALMQKCSMQKIKTFTIGFKEDSFNEAQFARKVANHIGTDHTEIILTANDALEVIQKLPHIYDEPFADSSQIPTHLVSLAASQSLTVALTGDGGDEIFGGYNRYFWTERLWNKLALYPPSLRSFAGKIFMNFPNDGWKILEKLFNLIVSPEKGISQLSNKAFKLGTLLKNTKNIDQMYFNLISTQNDVSQFVKGLPKNFSSEQLKFFNSTKQLEPFFKNSSEEMMYWDTMTYLPDDILCKVDRASMATSLETRAPFLDHRLVEFAWRLPIEMKIHNNSGKWILRQLLNEHVPKDLIERPKLGFGLPVGDWLRDPLREWAEDLLDEKKMNQEGFFYTDPIQKIWKEHISRKYDWTECLWSILMFQSWLKAEKDL